MQIRTIEFSARDWRYWCRRESGIELLTVRWTDGWRDRETDLQQLHVHQGPCTMCVRSLKPVRRTWWNKTEIKHWNCFSLIGIFFNTAKLFQCFSFRDVRTSEIKLQLNNAAGGRLNFTRPHIPETEIKQNCRRSAETKPRPSAVLFYFTMCDGLNRCIAVSLWPNFASPTIAKWRRPSANVRINLILWCGHWFPSFSSLIN